MDILGLIPARGGSKSIPHKNIALLGGRPLLAYTCDAAKNSLKLTRTILNTDDQEIARVGRELGLEVPFMRPAELAQDDTPAFDVVQQTLAELESTEGYRPEAVVLLQPTSPLRRAEHIDAAIDILLETGADSVVTVIEVPHHFNPVSLMRLEQGRLMPYVDGPLILRRQDKPEVYARNGPVVLAMRSSTIAGGSLYGNDCRPLLMNPEDSWDIDAPMDLLIVETLLANRKTDAPT